MITCALSNPMTFLASPSARTVQSESRSAKFVPVNTMRSRGESSCGVTAFSERVNHIVAVGSSEEMGGIHAGAIVAVVAYVRSDRNGSDEHFIHNAMGLMGFPVDPHASVSAIAKRPARPFPA